ncbi:MAG: hypothetical protein WKG03_00510 [Telluria sp.]
MTTFLAVCMAVLIAYIVTMWLLRRIYTVRWCNGYAFAYTALRRGHAITMTQRRTGAYAQGVDAALEDQGKVAIRRAVMVRGVHRVGDSQGILE